MKRTRYLVELYVMKIEAVDGLPVETGKESFGEQFYQEKKVWAYLNTLSEKRLIELNKEG